MGTSDATPVVTAEPAPVGGDTAAASPTASSTTSESGVNVSVNVSVSSSAPSPPSQPTPASNDATDDDDDDDDGYQILIVPSDTEEDGDDDGDDTDEGERQGSISSARFNILSTMVGGGCLSLPLAFQQSGNALTAPLLLILTGLVTDFCFRLLVQSSIKLNPPHFTRPGKDSFESITSAAFGPSAFVFSMTLVTLMCFFGAVGYSVLLRDMMEPINDMIFDKESNLLPRFVTNNEWLHKNFTLFVVILVVTPACTLTNFTALKNCGAASMTSIFILGTCIVIRSVQCNINSPSSDQGPWYSYLKLWPESPRELLNAVPLYISCFVCHYNILPVHNELANPTPARVSWWLRSTTWYSVALYMIMGFAGSTYGHCTPSGKVQGNVLLDFDENDPLLMVGRMCLALTITLAFPMLVIPARDIMLRSIIMPWLNKRRQTGGGNSEEEIPSSRSVPPAEAFPPPIATSTLVERTTEDELQEPLLQDEEGQVTESNQDSSTMKSSFLVRLMTSIVIFWIAGGVASCVESIDIVWDLLGSSLSILLSYLIPCGTYLVIMRGESGHFWSKVLCWILILFMTPLMIISTGNAIDNTFFNNKD